MSESNPPDSPPAVDAPGAADRPPRRDDRDGGGFRGRRDDRPRGPQTVKARLRAKARKKARKQKKMFQRRKVCRFCVDKRLEVDYKEAKTLRLFCSETGKITPRRPASRKRRVRAST